jgi:hypothetical protein
VGRIDGGRQSTKRAQEIIAVAVIAEHGDGNQLAHA